MRVNKDADRNAEKEKGDEDDVPLAFVFNDVLSDKKLDNFGLDAARLEARIEELFVPPLVHSIGVELNVIFWVHAKSIPYLLSGKKVVAFSG